MRFLLIPFHFLTFFFVLFRVYSCDFVVLFLNSQLGIVTAKDTNEKPFFSSCCTANDRRRDAWCTVAALGAVNGTVGARDGKGKWFIFVSKTMPFYADLVTQSQPVIRIQRTFRRGLPDFRRPIAHRAIDPDARGAFFG